MTHGRKIGVLGLGYVGLPVAVNMGTKSAVIGFDVNQKRVSELNQGIDRTNEVEAHELSQSDVKFSSSIEDLKECDFFIVAVPTPVDDSHKPDLTPMISASKSIAKVLKKGDIVVYESTVYPGVCEDICMPILEKETGLKGGVDFKIGYSPERINPGDKEHSFTKITKIVSAQDTESLDIVANVYGSVVTAGIFKATSIKVAEAAKVIENTQRDINIALMNELATIFDKLNIDTKDVLEAAGTKWNFLKFYPGLVGGHCIGVDPYYLTHKAEQAGCHPQMILAGRRINDGMAKFIAEKTTKKLISADKKIKSSKVLILGLTFKEDCPDIRNSMVFDIIEEMNDFGVNLVVHDPKVLKEDIPSSISSKFIELTDVKDVDAIILAVGHKEYKEMGVSHFLELMADNSVFIDVKGVFKKNDFLSSGRDYWRL